MTTPASATKALGKALALSVALGLTGLGFMAQEGHAATRPIRPGGSTPPPTVVDPNPPPRPSQMVAGRNAGNIQLSTPLSTAGATQSTTRPSVIQTTDP
jgi:hypothetical protein